MTEGPSARHRRARAWLVARFAVPLSLMLGIFVSSHRPLPGSVPGEWDKVLHAVAYAILAAAWFQALAATRATRVAAAFASAVVAVAWGVIDEVHQSFVPGRFASAGDAVADAVGAVAASALLLSLGRLRVAPDGGSAGGS